MGHTKKNTTSSDGSTAKVPSSSGRFYVVEEAASIRTYHNWRLGTLEKDTFFLAVYRSKKKRNWVWGLAIQGPSAAPLTYKDHHRCGWILLDNLRRPKADERRPAAKRPNISLHTWTEDVFKTIKYLFINKHGEKKSKEEVKNMSEKEQEKYKKRWKKKDYPVRATRVDKKRPVIGYKNTDRHGEQRTLDGPIGVRYLNKSGWYMAWAENFRWCFVHESDLRRPSKKIAEIYGTRGAKRRAQG